MNEFRISVIIVSYNTCDILRKCLDSLFENSGKHELEVFVVDNNSADNSTLMVKDNFKNVSVIENNENLGFAAANNQAFEKASGKYIVLLNPDAFVKPDAMDNAIAFMESHAECGICSGRLINLDNELDPSARRFPNSLYKFFTISGLSDKYPSSRLFGKGDFKFFDHKSVIEVDWVPGTFGVYRKSMLDKIELFDNRFYIYYEETDLCLRAKRAGWKIYFIPDAQVIHIGGACSKTRKDQKFDTSGSQVLKFRMRSEYLYFRKNFNILSVLANAGVEILWNAMRWLMNLRPGENRRLKRLESASIIKFSVKALIDTVFGSLSPTIPW